MSHKTSWVRVQAFTGRDVPPEDAMKWLDIAFIGEPELPLTEEEQAQSKWDALDKACTAIREEQLKIQAPFIHEGPPDAEVAPTSTPTPTE